MSLPLIILTGAAACGGGQRHIAAASAGVQAAVENDGKKVYLVYRRARSCGRSRFLHF